MEVIKKMNKIPAVLCMIMILALIVAPYAYADNDIDATDGTQTAAKELILKRSYPQDGDTHLQIDNTGIKLFFNGNVIDKSVWENNSTKFTFTDKKGKKIKTKAYSSEAAGTEYILVVVESGQSLASNSDYLFTVGAGLKSKEGHVLSEDIILNFTTVNVEGNTKVNMGLMALMVVGMIVMTVLSTKRQERKQEVKKEDKVNPYKIAKEKGKSVEEVMAQIEKEKARKAKKSGKKSQNDSPDDDDTDDTYRVKNPRPISTAGSTYKTGRKALVEKKAKEEAAKKAKGTTNPKKKGGKKKGNKKK